MKKRISKNIERMQNEMGDKYWNISASGIFFRRKFSKILETYSEGRLIDLGAGNLLYKSFLKQYCEIYESLDIRENPDLDYVQDIQDTDLDSNVFDTVFCRNVLEHVENPRRAMSEISRILKDGGVAIVSVPHLAYLHNEPEDYYRFTKYGLEEIASDTELKTIETHTAGGLFSFLGYIFSTVFLGLTYDIRVLSWFNFRINFLIQYTCFKADDLFKTDRYMALNYVAVFRKTS